MTALETRPSTAVDAMWARKPHIAAVLPDHIDVKSFIGTAAAALYANPDLMHCAERNPASLLIALMHCASLGHRPGTEEFYLTPRGLKGSKRGPEIVGIEGYRGIVERMYRSGAVASVVVREVCANDSFSYVEGRDDKPTHSFGGHGKTGADFFGKNGGHDRGEMVGVYAYAVLTTGAVSRVVLLNRADVLAARDAGGYSPNDSHSPWNRLDAGKDRPEFQGRSMWWKTAARRLEPWVPTSAEYRREQLRAEAAAAPAAPAAEWQPPAPAGPDEIHDAEIVGELERAEPKATTGQVSIIDAKFRALGYDDSDPQLREERLIFIAELAGLHEDSPLTSPADLTQDLASRVIGHLKTCATRDDLLNLLRNGEAPDT